MRPVRLPATLLGLALLVTTSSAQSKIQPVQFSDTRLGNGLRVIISEDHYAPVFAIAVSYGVGSKDERPGRTGFAHLFEHMMFKGSENVGPGEHFFLVFNYGGSMNGTTNTDRTLYYEIMPKNQLDLGLFLESDRMRSLAITKENLDNQRQAVQEERRLGLDNQPYGKSQERFNELAYDNFAYKHSVIGSMEDLNAATVDDVASFFRPTMRRTMRCVALVGDLDTKATLAEGREVLRQHSPSAESEAGRSVGGGYERRAARDAWTTRWRAWPRSTSATGFRRPPRPDWPALSALGQILGGGESSRLYQRLVKEKELCSSIGSGSGARMGPALFTHHVLGACGQEHRRGRGGHHRGGVASCRPAPVTDPELQRVRTSARRAARRHPRERARARAVAGRQRRPLQRSQPDQHAHRRDRRR